MGAGKLRRRALDWPLYDESRGVQLRSGRAFRVVELYGTKGRARRVVLGQHMHRPGAFERRAANFIIAVRFFQPTCSGQPLDGAHKA